MSAQDTRTEVAATRSPRRRHGAVRLRPGDRLGPFVLEEELGAGATAVVYRARDELLDRVVALKLLTLEDDTIRERFLNEMRVIAGIQHPNVVAVHAADVCDDLHYAALEFLTGSLQTEIERCGRMPWRDALAKSRDACLGLQAALASGVIHRDVKPANLLVGGDGRIKVADFGLAKDLAGDLELTESGMVLGTPLYMSPEQGAGHVVDHRTDIYSTGATLFRLIAGRRLFHASTPMGMIVRHAVEPPPVLDDVPPAVAALVQAMLAKLPADRPQTWDEVIERIDATLAAPDEVGPAAPAELPSRRRPSDPLVSSQLAAAEAALRLGRTERARRIYERVASERGDGWVEAALALAVTLEREDELEAARRVLEEVVAEAGDADDRALALWSLGGLLEKQAAWALRSAVGTYRRILEVSGTGFPKALLQARIDRLEAAATSGPSMPSTSGRKAPGVAES